MQSTNMNALLPFVDRSNASTIRVEGKAQREGTSLFGEVLDTVNPLQHVPGVSQAYRAITKDKISGGAKLAGHIGLGAAVGGPVGAAVGAGVFLIESVFGAIFGGGKKSSEKLVQAENVKSGPTVLNSGQAIHAGKMRGYGAGIPMQAAATQLAAHEAGTAQRRAAAPVASPAAAAPAQALAAPSLGTAPVEMSSAQFAALLGAFGGSAPMTAMPTDREDDRQRAVAQTQAVSSQNSAAISGADFAERMAANLDKLDALKRGGGGQ